jgi:hypothetical protein
MQALVNKFCIQKMIYNQSVGIIIPSWKLWKFDNEMFAKEGKRICVDAWQTNTIGSYGHIPLTFSTAL